MKLNNKYNKKHIKWLFIITFLSIIIKILWIYKIPCVPVSDFKVYQDIATNIYLHKSHYYMGKPIAFQGMGYPTLLGVWYSIVQSNKIIFGKIFNVILSSFTLILIFGILDRLTLNKKVVFISYVIIAFLPNYIAYNNVLGSECLSLFLLTLILFIEVFDINLIIKYLLMGILIGFLSLTKPYFLPYSLVIFVIDILKYKDIKKSLAMFLSIFFISIMIIFPWTYRNYKLYKCLIPISYNGGYVLFINNNSNNKTGAWMPISNIEISNKLKWNLEKEKFHYKAPIEVEMKDAMLNYRINNILKYEAKNWIKSHPVEFIKLGFKRINNTFFSGASDIFMWCINGNYYILYLLKKICNFIVYALSLSGVVYVVYNIKNLIISLFKNNIKCDYKISIPCINIMFFMAIPFVFEGQARYNFLILFIFVFCAVDMFINSYNNFKKYK